MASTAPSRVVGDVLQRVRGERSRALLLSGPRPCRIAPAAVPRFDRRGGIEGGSARPGGEGSEGTLAATGANGITENLALAGAARGTGLVVARLAGGRWRDAGREVARSGGVCATSPFCSPGLSPTTR